MSNIFAPGALRLKSSREETKGGTVLQLSLYSDLVGRAQGLIPQSSHVIAPWTEYQPQSFRNDDFAAYYRHVKASLECAVQLDEAVQIYPDPKSYCDVCRWQDRCDAKRRKDDHLSLIAGISKSQIAELEEHAITTGATLAAMPIPLPFKPSRGSTKALQRVREQARIQIEGRAAGKLLYERLAPMSGIGLAKLHGPSPADIFFDLEGDPFVGYGGIEYLFGYSFLDDARQERYMGSWALSRAQERASFEQFIDFVTNRLNVYPDLHIYHFAPYEPAALKRLMGRYATPLEVAFPNQYSEKSRNQTARHAASSWTQSGHLAGRTKKTRQHVKPTVVAVTMAFFLGNMAGYHGAAVFSNPWCHLLDLNADRAKAMGFDAHRASLLDLRAVGDVVELSFPLLAEFQDFIP
jgi:predicted RecB family nuclease